MPATRGQVNFSDGKTVVSLFKSALLHERKKVPLGDDRLATCYRQRMGPPNGTVNIVLSGPFPVNVWSGRSFTIQVVVLSMKRPGAETFYAGTRKEPRLETISWHRVAASGWDPTSNALWEKF